MRKDVKDSIFLNTEYESYMVGDNVSVRGSQIQLLSFWTVCTRRAHPRHHSFHQRIVNQWNSLPATVVNSPTLNTFKNRLDNHWSGLPLKFDHTARDFDPC